MRRIVAFAAAATMAAVTLAGCGGDSVDPGISSGDDLAAGKQLFLGEGQCAGCHTLADAGSTATIGPNLDDAFRYSRDDGFSDVTFEQVVREQMEIPAVIAPGSPDRPPVVNMPSRTDLGLTKEQADNIAYYVATCGGLTPEEAAETCPAAIPPPAPPPAAEPPGPPPPGDGAPSPAAEHGKQVFLDSGCGTCHTFTPAGTSGTVGPNLDETQLDHAAIVAQVTNGGGGMPPFGQQLQAQDIDDVAEFVLSARP